MNPRKIRLPFSWPIALVLGGMVVRADAALGQLVPLRLDPAVLGYFLPALIFEAAWDFDAALLRSTAIAITALAVPGVVITMFIVAGGVLFSRTLDWAPALVLGAIVSATDPVAVLALFRRLRMPPKLLAIVEGESVANDGVAVVLVQALVAVTAGGLAMSLTAVAGRIMSVSLGGMLVGVVIAIPLGWLLRRLPPLWVQAAITVVIAYGSYVLAQRAGFSGIFASVAAGLVAPAFAGYTGRDDATRLRVERFWDVAAWVANAALFFLVGLNLRVEWLVRAPLLSAAALLAVLLARVILAYVLVPLRSLTDAPGAWRHVIALAGLRGGLSLALALGLPFAFPQRAQVLYATAAIVFATLVVQGLLTPQLVRRLVPSDSGAC
ncbi:MAG TPA: cation:proton antiporter [Candidatus Acidoferrales bacterium]|nr:cation:proton antiporter [Candidatus Acidoferrales bacterium]